MAEVSDSPLAVITGALGGIGMATTRRFLQDGWAVLAIDHNPAATAATEPRLTLLQQDLRDADAASGILRAVSEIGNIQAVIHLAAISQGTRPLVETEDSGWEDSFLVNVTAPMRLDRCLAPLLCEQKQGSIVHVGSPVGLVGASKPAYAASKAALHGLTMSFARACGPYNVRVNTLLPGTTITGMTADWSEQKRKDVAAQTFLGRLCLPEEVAAVIAFLCGPDSRYMTGSIVDMTAGGLWGH